MASRSPIHDPLKGDNYIRIIILHPGKPEDEISCVLKCETRRRSKNKYAAISYVWGDASHTQPIRCNGQVVNIGRNLADALRRFRHRTTIRRLWADALCIDQDDDREKGQQVSRMGQVYRNASCVLVWLGRDEDDCADECFRSVRILNDFYDRDFLRSDRQYINMKTMRVPESIRMSDGAYDSIRKLQNLPWFNRVWTVQECAVAKQCRMFWGEAFIDCAEVFEISAWARENLVSSKLTEEMLIYKFRTMHCAYYEAPSWQSTLPAIDLDRGNFSKSMCFVQILRASDTFRATDPRDHVYAFLGCPYAKNENGEPLLEVDYSSTVEEVFHRTACTLLRSTKEGPWLLSYREHMSRSKLLGMKRPSWVPHWNVDNTGPPVGDRIYLYRAGGDEDTFSAESDGGPLLRVKGFVFDTVCWRSDTFTSIDFSLTQNHSTNDAAHGHESFVEALWRTVSLAARDLDMAVDYETFGATLTTGWGFWAASHHQALHERFATYHNVTRSTSPGYSGPSTEFSKKDLSMVWNTADRLWQHTRNKCLILTQNGGMGLASGATAVGDACCVVLGATVPFTLAPVANGHYKLLGDSYVHGVMGGELVEKFHAHEIVLE